VSGVTSRSQSETLPIASPPVLEVTRMRLGRSLTLNRLRWNMYSPESSKRAMFRSEVNDVPGPVSFSSRITIPGVVGCVVRAST
jgi:hypothetical protein